MIVSAVSCHICWHETETINKTYASHGKIQIRKIIRLEKFIKPHVMYEKMIQTYQKITQFKVLRLFLNHPYTSYYLRESARILDMDPMTVKRSLNLLIEDMILIRKEEKNRILYQLNLENPSARYLKISYNLSWLHEKRIVEFILNKMKTVTSIILFGSFAKGENDEDSDVDILTISLSDSKPTTELAKILGRDVNLLNFTPAEWSKQAKNNKGLYQDVLIDGIALHGSKPVIV